MIEILLRGPKPRELISDSGFETVQSTHGIASEAFRNTWTCHHSSTSTSVVLGIPLASFALVIQGSHQCCYYLSTPPAFKSGGRASGKEHSCRLLSRQSAHTCSLPKWLCLFPVFLDSWAQKGTTAIFRPLVQRQDCHRDHLRTPWE